MKEIRVAAVSTASFDGEEDYKNAGQAQAYVEEAAKNGAQLVCFPEGYPGPCFGPMDSGGHLAKKPAEMLCDSAKRHHVYISCGDLEEDLKIRGGYYLTHKLISPKGKILANYRRCQPTPPVLNASLYGGKKHLLPGDEIVVVDTELGRIGLLICSELFVPELARIQMLMGAEIILAPVGGSHKGASLAESLPGGQLSTWQCLARARATENLLYVVLAVNIFSPEQKRGSFIAGPEDTVATSIGPGITYGNLDMDRIWHLRTRYVEESDTVAAPKGSASYKPRMANFGAIHDRRPELYHKLIEPQESAYNFFYYRKGLGTWPEEYERVHHFTRKPSEYRD